MAENSSKKPSMMTSSFFLKILETIENPVYYDRLRGYVSESSVEIKNYVRKKCRGEGLLTFFKRRKKLFYVDDDDCVGSQQKPRKKKTVTELEDDLASDRYSGKSKQNKTCRKKARKSESNIISNPYQSPTRQRSFSYNATSKDTIPDLLNFELPEQSVCGEQKSEEELENETVEYFKNLFDHSMCSYSEIKYHTLPYSVKAYLKLKYPTNKILRFLLDHYSVFSIDDDGNVYIMHSETSDNCSYEESEEGGNSSIISMENESEISTENEREEVTESEESLCNVDNEFIKNHEPFLSSKEITLSENMMLKECDIKTNDLNDISNSWHSATPDIEQSSRNISNDGNNVISGENEDAFYSKHASKETISTGSENVPDLVLNNGPQKIITSDKQGISHVSKKIIQSHAKSTSVPNLPFNQLMENKTVSEINRYSSDNELLTLIHFAQVLEKKGKDVFVLIERLHGHLAQASKVVINYVKKVYKGRLFKKFFTGYPKIFYVNKNEVKLTEKYFLHLVELVNSIPTDSPEIAKTVVVDNDEGDVLPVVVDQFETEESQDDFDDDTASSESSVIIDPETGKITIFDKNDAKVLQSIVGQFEIEEWQDDFDDDTASSESSVIIDPETGKITIFDKNDAKVLQSIVGQFEIEERQDDFDDDTASSESSVIIDPETGKITIFDKNDAKVLQSIVGQFEIEERQDDFDDDTASSESSVIIDPETGKITIFDKNDAKVLQSIVGQFEIEERQDDFDDDTASSESSVIIDPETGKITIFDKNDANVLPSVVGQFEIKERQEGFNNDIISSESSVIADPETGKITVFDKNDGDVLPIVVGQFEIKERQEGFNNDTISSESSVIIYPYSIFDEVVDEDNLCHILEKDNPETPVSLCSVMDSVVSELPDTAIDEYCKFENLECDNSSTTSLDSCRETEPLDENLQTGAHVIVNRAVCESQKINTTIYDRDYDSAEQDEILEDFPTFYCRFICVYTRNESVLDNNMNNESILNYTKKLWQDNPNSNDDFAIDKLIQSQLENLSARSRTVEDLPVETQDCNQPQNEETVYEKTEKTSNSEMSDVFSNNGSNTFDENKSADDRFEILKLDKEKVAELVLHSDFSSEKKYNVDTQVESDKMSMDLSVQIESKQPSNSEMMSTDVGFVNSSVSQDLEYFEFVPNQTLSGSESSSVDKELQNVVPEHSDVYQLEEGIKSQFDNTCVMLPTKTDYESTLEEVDESPNLECFLQYATESNINSVSQASEEKSDDAGHTDTENGSTMLEDLSKNPEQECSVQLFVESDISVPQEHEDECDDDDDNLSTLEDSSKNTEHSMWLPAENDIISSSQEHEDEYGDGAEYTENDLTTFEDSSKNSEQESTIKLLLESDIVSVPQEHGGDCDDDNASTEEDNLSTLEDSSKNTEHSMCLPAEHDIISSFQEHEDEYGDEYTEDEYGDEYTEDDLTTFEDSSKNSEQECTIKLPLESNIISVPQEHEEECGDDDNNDEDASTEEEYLSAGEDSDKNKEDSVWRPAVSDNISVPEEPKDVHDDLKRTDKEYVATPEECNKNIELNSFVQLVNSINVLNELEDVSYKNREFHPPLSNVIENINPRNEFSLSATNETSIVKTDECSSSSTDDDDDKTVIGDVNFTEDIMKSELTLFKEEDKFEHNQLTKGSNIPHLSPSCSKDGDNGIVSSSSSFCQQLTSNASETVSSRRNSDLNIPNIPCQTESEIPMSSLGMLRLYAHIVLLTKDTCIAQATSNGALIYCLKNSFLCRNHEVCNCFSNLAVGEAVICAIVSPSSTTVISIGCQFSTTDCAEHQNEQEIEISNVMKVENNCDVEIQTDVVVRSTACQTISTGPIFHTKCLVGDDLM